jgi:hypothetical protein
VAAIVGGADEYLDRPAPALLEAFARQARSARAFTGLVVPRANHSFVGHERALAALMVRWIREARLHTRR